ncbi:MAG: amidohydrolase [Streptosporangiaceae bacterium]
MGRSVAIIGGYVVPGVGEPADGGTVLIEDGRVAAVGRNVAIPDGVEVVDVSGKWVVPGFVDGHAHVGVHEEAEGWAGDDTNERTDPNGAGLRAIDAINPADKGFPDALSGGVLTAVVKPGSANPIGGRTVALKCWGRVVDEMAFREPASVKSALGENPKRVYGDKKQLPSTRLGVASVIRDAFTKTRDYMERRANAEAGGSPVETDPRLEALGMVLRGEVPWCQHCHRADDVATAVRLAEEFGYRLVVNHGTEAHLIADFLAEKNIPVITGPLFTARAKIELRQRTLKGPGVLARAGVLVAIMTDHPVVPIHFLVHQATLAMKEGLDRDEALRAITVNPARMLGIDDRVGSLEPGKDGDVCVWSGDPLDVLQRCERAYIEGREVYRYDTGRDEGVVTDPYGANSIT